MPLEEELEILRDEPIQVVAGNPMNIPCIETSDPEKLCKRPVVSVHMSTFNHEPYIRQAIEGVMMQKTDFEFELVIGEDASTDKTREICFEYQKRYPDKIRVLWWHENLYRNPHPAGDNGARTMAHCRGDFIAFCEGDDYWTDPLKLQKQVDVMKASPSVGLCFCGAEMTKSNSPEVECAWDGSAFTPGRIERESAFKTICYGREAFRWAGGEGFLMTASIMLRKSVLDAARAKYDLLKWRLNMGDTSTWLGVVSLSDAFYISDKVSVYRRTSSGALGSNAYKTNLDACLARLYYTVDYLGLSLHAALRIWGDLIALEMRNKYKLLSAADQRAYAASVRRNALLKMVYVRLPTRIFVWLMRFGLLNRWTSRLPAIWTIKTHAYPWKLLETMKAMKAGPC